MKSEHSESTRPITKVKANISSLNLSLKDKADYLCLNFDPYQEQEHIPEKEMIFLTQLGLDEFIGDPYRLTKELLLLQERLSSMTSTNTRSDAK